MFVYAVLFTVQYEGDNLIGIFSDYVKAREFELAYIQKHNVAGDYEWTEIRKIELNKVYDTFEIFNGIGEEV